MTMAQSRHAGRVAFVTGAGSGIGRETAWRLAAEGCAVACADIKHDQASQTAERITADGGTAAVVAADVRERAEVQPPWARRPPGSAA